MKPKIYLYGTSGQYGNYLAALTEAGAEPVLSRDLFRACGCDGLLLPGGGDIGDTLEATDSFLIRSFADSGRPILGICRGMQALNVFFRRHAPRPHPRTSAGAGRSDPPHTGQRTAFAAAGAGPLVNSNHHQAVRVLGEELCLLQQAADGTIEGFCHETLPILGVQWHPERQSGARLRADAVDAGPLLRYFVGQCSCKSAPGLVHCEKRGEADESHHTGTKSGAGTAHGG